MISGHGFGLSRSVPRGAETPDQAWRRFMHTWGALQQLPFLQLSACAAVAEILSALHERLVVGSLAAATSRG